MYKYYNKEGQYVIGRKIGNEVMVGSKIYTEYEMMWHDARYIRIDGVRYIREDFIETH